MSANLSHSRQRSQVRVTQPSTYYLLGSQMACHVTMAGEDTVSHPVRVPIAMAVVYDRFGGLDLLT